MTRFRKHTTDTYVYIVMWTIVVGFFLLNTIKARTSMGLPMLGQSTVVHLCSTLIPYILLFWFNNALINKVLMKNRTKAYLIYVTILILLMWGWQYFEFHFDAPRKAPKFPDHAPPFRSLIPMPLLTDWMYTLLVVGTNLAVALIFQRYTDRLEHESMMKANAENELANLKAQINPHFYMNMLNNIHGMIEIDPEKAQGMVIDMSSLMRYMLYDSSRELIPLTDEIDFLRNYIRVMERRYPPDKVSISLDFPSKKEAEGIQVPPLLFLVFAENAFKHGISYREPSSVEISMKIAGKGSEENSGHEAASRAATLEFSCINTCHSDGSTPPGIGLANIRQRLRLLYGDRATLAVNRAERTFYVTLIIPLSPC